MRSGVDMEFMSSAEDAFAVWEQAIGTVNVRRTPEELARYRAGTTPSKANILGALLPENRDHVVDLIRIAQTHHIPVYPISTGRNWGYGDARPVRDGCVIIDLSRMNRILDIDPELGIATLEPGVTQMDLYRYLDKNGLEFMVPTTGAGPSCSIIGNALERGYGITPQADHFLSLNWIEAVLSNGAIYQTPLTSLTSDVADKAFKWGVGPYLDGLFSQGAFGVVTRAAVTLVKTPEVVEAFYFRLQSNESLQSYVGCLHDLLDGLGPLVGGVNLMNARRVLSMLTPYPTTTVDGVLSDDQLRDLMNQEDVPCWLGLGTLYGSEAMVAVARKVVRDCLKPIDRRVRFVNSRTISRRQRVVNLLPEVIGNKPRRTLRRARGHLDILEGRPSEVALGLSYWRAGNQKPATDLNPARDSCGLLWYAPLVPMKQRMIRNAVDMIQRVCKENKIEPLMTLTSLSNRCFDLTVPILFSQGDRAQTEDARRCFQQLFREGQKIGVAPYRVGVEAMPLLVQPTPYWQLVSSLKAAVDPHNIIAPGRYGLT
jgi:4-cresol dehydrogenase (hydroxylating) flavoprotein subunit